MIRVSSYQLATAKFKFLRIYQPQMAAIWAKLHYTSCLDGVWIKIKKVWINPNNSHESLDRSKLRPSQTPTIHPSEFFGHITFSVPNIKLQKMKSESCWKLYNIQSKNSIIIMWSVQLCIARMGVDGGGAWKGLHGFCVQYSITSCFGSYFIVIQTTSKQMILSRCSTNFPNTEPMACSYSCDDQTRIHESKEGIPFIALRITLSFLH